MNEQTNRPRCRHSNPTDRQSKHAEKSTSQAHLPPRLPLSALSLPLSPAAISLDFSYHSWPCRVASPSTNLIRSSCLASLVMRKMAPQAAAAAAAVADASHLSHNVYVVHADHIWQIGQRNRFHALAEIVE